MTDTQANQADQDRERTGAEYFDIHAGIALNDAEDPIEGWDAAYLLEIQLELDSIAKRIQHIIDTGQDPTLDDPQSKTYVDPNNLLGADYIAAHAEIAIDDVRNDPDKLSQLHDAVNNQISQIAAIRDSAHDLPDEPDHQPGPTEPSHAPQM